MTIKKENSPSGIVEKFNIFDVGEVIEIVIVVRNEPSVVTNVTGDRTVYLTPVLLINLFHKLTIHLYPRRAFSNRILIQIELQTYSNRITNKKNRL